MAEGDSSYLKVRLEKNMRKNILMYALAGKNWLGGIYYIKNLLFQLSISDEAQNKYSYYMIVNKDVINEFSEFIQPMKIEMIECNETDELQLLSVCNDFQIDVVLPIGGGGYTWLIKDISLYWIPDFQEIHLPENFSLYDIEDRKRTRDYISNEHGKLILSSNDAYNDYKNLCPQNKDNVFVVHFTSYIKPLIEQMTDDFEKQVMEKYKIKYEYIFVANQFWKHKNHIVVLRAMNMLINERKEKIHLVCTGFMNSYDERDEYVDNLYKYVENNNFQEYVHFLGLVERIEQLCIMKNARLLVQPSKFEGWGCSVEDGKVLGKEMLISDINVHKEQQYPKATLFPQNDAEALAKLILDKFSHAQKYDLEYGNQYVMQKAEQYSKEFQKAIDSIKIDNNKDYLEELERRRKEKIIELFGDLCQNQICIYGVGNCTRNMIKNCRQILGYAGFVYSDSDENKWGTDFEGGKVYSPSQILNLGVKRIVISSIKYQEEIYQSLKKFEKDIEIVKIYNSDKEMREVLWI